ncbi:putative Major latex protein [Hibiscus syriacus]|uniref:Major latex protein n=1 Tax=Hibiscus syriacus TaxID=106335 RepID=A0A6A2ZGN3_HIBSY|nr:putative Major latex protein [Hibiscus syriacus]
MWAYRPHHVHHTSFDKVQGCDLHEGEFGKPGVIICWKYVHDGKAKTAKQVVEEIDEENKSIRFKMLEGDLMEEYKSFVIAVKSHPKKDGEGSIAHWTLKYEMLHDGIGHLESLRQFFIELTGDMGGHLVNEK